MPCLEKNVLWWRLSLDYDDNYIYSGIIMQMNPFERYGLIDNPKNRIHFDFLSIYNFFNLSGWKDLFWFENIKFIKDEK